MKRSLPAISLSLLLAACQSPITQLKAPTVPPNAAASAVISTSAETATTLPVVIQKSPVLPQLDPKPEGQIKVQSSKVHLEVQLPALRGFSTQGLDLAGDNADKIVATVSDSHGNTYTPDGAVGGKVNYPANGAVSLDFSDVVPDQLIVIEMFVEDNTGTKIVQTELATVISHTATTDVTDAKINFQTTPTALAMKGLIAADADRARAINLADLVTKMAEVTGVAGTGPFTYTTHPALVNVSNLITDLGAQQPAALNAADYRKVGATVNLTVTGLVGTDKVQVDITDAASSRATNVAATGSSISGIAEGTGLKVKVGAEASNSTQYSFVVAASPLTLTEGSTSGVTIAATPVPVVVNNLSPTSGAIASQVTITGTGFSTNTANNTVRFGTTTANVVSVNTQGTSMVVDVPAGISGTQSVTVQVGSQTSGGDNFEVLPVVNTLSTAVATIGSSMTLTGTGFSTTASQNTVRFGSKVVPGGDVSVNGAGTVLTVTVPTEIAGAQSITVQVGNQTSAGNGFNVIPVLNALAVPAATPDTVLTLTGSGFSQTNGNNQIRFGTVTANSTSVNTAGTSITVVVPNVAGSMNLNVTVAGQNTVNRTFESVPKITSITPAATGSTGNTITLNGKGFSAGAPANNTLRLGTLDVNVGTASSTALTFTVPETPAKVANATVRVGNQTSAASNFNILPRINAVSTTTGAVGGKAVLVPGDTLTITGTNFDPTPGNNSIRFGTTAVAAATASATQLTVTVPASINTPGDVAMTVVTGAQTSNSIAATVPSINLNISNGGYH